jgi:hypothetical protein
MDAATALLCVLNGAQGSHAEDVHYESAGNAELSAENVHTGLLAFASLGPWRKNMF